MELSKMSLADMRALQVKLVEEIEKREQEEVAKARQQIMEIAQSVGLPLKDLIGANDVARPRKAKAGNAARYRHPANTALQWGGRGRKPQWVKDWLADGKPLDSLKV